MGKKVDGSFSQETKEIILERDCNQCIVCGGPVNDIHHRRPRSAGGTSVEWVGSASNGISLCRAHHESIESNRDDAKAKGWLIPATWTQVTAMTQPCFYPVLGVRFYLDPDGAMREAPSDDPEF